MYALYWSTLLLFGHPLYLINHIESAQKSFTKRLPFCKPLSYAERLTNLRLQSLEHRRMIFDSILVFKIIHGFSCLNFDDFFSFANNNRSSRGHPFRLYIPINKNNTCHFFFSSRVILVWNYQTFLFQHQTPFRSRRHDLSKFLHFPTFFAWIIFFRFHSHFRYFYLLLLNCLFVFGYKQRVLTCIYIFFSIKCVWPYCL